jgi:hypothetical protein
MRTIFVSLALLFLSAGVHAADSISTVLPCGKPGVAGGLGAGVDLTRYMIDTTKFPNGVCNDGTPGVFYYAPATRAEDANRWLIFLQGGGSCGSGQKCAERWCSIDSNYGMDKMSSSLTKAQIRGGGFLSPESRNAFGSWNRVLIYYCSSDQWNGTKATTVTAASTSGATVEFEIQFRGSEIVDAVLDTLRNHTPGSKRRVVRHDVRASIRHDFGAEPHASDWPDLDNAITVIFAGASGGGNGVKNNVDHVGEKLKATNSGLADFRAIIDASFTFETSGLDYTKSTFCAQNPSGCAYDTFVQGTWSAVDRSLYDGRGDESCRQYHESRVPGSEWICSDKDHVTLNHITTPFFIHQDLQDPQVGGDGFVQLGLGTASDFAIGVESALRNLPVPEEPRGATPGSFAPQCGTHEAFTNNSDVFNIRVNGINWHDTVWNWLIGAQPQQSIQAYSGVPGPIAGCP